MQVMIVEDQPLVVEGLRSVLTEIDSEPDIRCALLASRALTMLRGGLNPQTNAVGSFIFLCSILMLVAVELLLFRKRRA